MNLGALDRTVSFQAAVSQVDDLNEETAAGWATVHTVRASRDPVRDAERVAGAQVQREVTDRFTTHWSGALAALALAEHQLLCEGVAYTIVGRKELGRRKGLEWSCAARPDLAAGE